MSWSDWYSGLYWIYGFGVNNIKGIWKIRSNGRPGKCWILSLYKTSNGFKKEIIKISKQKDVAKIRSSKKKLREMGLSSVGLRGKVYINCSLSKYKFLWKKCKSLHSNQFIHVFWFTNGTVQLKAVENGRVHVITHFRDLKELFPKKQYTT